MLAKLVVELSLMTTLNAESLRDDKTMRLLNNVPSLQSFADLPEGMDKKIAHDWHSTFLTLQALVGQLKEKLPAYMLPRNVLLLRRFPLNANGKYDRKALQLMLENTFGSHPPRAAMPHPADRPS